MAHPLDDAPSALAVLRGLPDPVVIVDPRGRILDATPAVRALLGWLPDALRGRSVGDLLVTPAPERVAAWLARHVEGDHGRTLATGRRVVARHREGHDLPVAASLSLVRLRGATHLVAVLRDDQVAEALEASRDLLLEQASRDALTGVWNRRAILRRLEAEVARARRQGEPVAVAMLDLDRFKTVNDAHGHVVGDAVLCEAIARATSVLRPYDDLGRYGGEEFLLVLSRTGQEVAARVAERVRAVVAAEPVVHEDRRVPITLSLGVAALHPHETAASLIGRADAALFEAKRAGRDRVRLAVPPP